MQWPYYVCQDLTSQNSQFLLKLGLEMHQIMEVLTSLSADYFTHMGSVSKAYCINDLYYTFKIYPLVLYKMEPSYLKRAPTLLAGCSAQVPKVQCQPLAAALPPGQECPGLNSWVTHSGLDVSGDPLLCQFKWSFSVQCWFLTAFIWVFTQPKGIWKLKKCSNT